MAELTRRAFLRNASVGAAAGVLAGGVVTAASGIASGKGQGRHSAAGVDAGTSDALIAHVRDVSSGEIALMVGTREVVYQDRALAAHLMNTARGAR